MSTDQAVLRALTDSTAAMTSVAQRLDSLEKSAATQIAELRLHIDNEIGRLESQMGTMNAHLENLVRESGIANAHAERMNILLAGFLDERKVEREHARQLATEELQDAREERKEDREERREVRAILVSVGSEAWALFKQPLAYLLTAAVGFAGWYYFGQPPPERQLPPTPPIEQTEGGEQASE